MQIVVAELSVARGGRTIIRDLSFSISSGEALLLTGPNGAGKTTLVRAIAGFLPVEAGSVHVEPADKDRDLPAICHYVGHLNGLKANLTAAENLAFWGEFLSLKPPQDLAGQVELALAAFELSALANIPAGYLSAGQRRRLALARLVVADRPVWLLDEPSVSLDAASTGLLAAAIESHLAKGNLAIIATHLPLGLARPRELSLGKIRPEAA